MRNEANIVRTGLTLNRLARRLRSRRFWLPVGILALVCVAIRETVALAATVLVNDLFVDNPAVFGLDGNWPLETSKVSPAIVTGPTPPSPRAASAPMSSRRPRPSREGSRRRPPSPT